MKKKKSMIPSEFEDVLGSIYSNAEGTNEVTNVDDVFGADTTLVEEDDIKEPPVKDTEDGKNKVKDEVVTVKDDDSDIPEDVLKNINNQTEPDKSVDDNEDNSEDSQEPTDADVIEAQQVSLLFDAVGQSLGWNMADIDENDRPVTVDGLTQYLKEVVVQNSVPQYADDRIRQLDEFVKNGGNFEDFYSVQSQRISFDNIDMEDEANQKAVVRELLKYDGYTDEQINKRIARYEDADMLVEESEDALERLKSIRQREIEEQTRQQEEYAKAQELKSKQFFEQVTNDINSLTDIRGINIPKEDRKALFEYIFKVDANGVSQYQKDFNQNLSKNLIESAYFTMKADALIHGAQRQGESSAAEKLRKMLRHSSRNHSVYNADERKQKSVVDLATGLF